jgi:hypothetical protein
MANWKRLTQGAEHIDVNLDHLIYMKRDGDETTLCFVGIHIMVKETPDEIHIARPVRSY